MSTSSTSSTTSSSSSVSTGLSTVNGVSRYTGLSGINTDQIVSELINAEKAPLYRLQQKQQLDEWRMDAYRSITSQVKSFNDSYLNATSTSTPDMLMTGTYKKYTTSNTSSSVASVTGGSISSTFSHNITVSNIAVAASTSSSATVSGGAGSSNQLSLTDSAATIASKLGLADTNFSLTINGKTTTFDGTTITTLSQFISAVNSSGAGVTMSYNSYADKFSIVSNSTGDAGNNIALSSSNSNEFLTKANLSTALSGGKDASFTLDGVSGCTSSSNTITVDGASITLSAEGSTTISSSLDVDTIVKNIESFVNQYNTLIAAVNSKISEKYDYDYPPLTEAQKSQMTTDEITSWNTKAQVGLLQHDDILSDMVTNMRAAWYDSVNGAGITLSSIGITTGTYSDKGKLIVDKTKLKSAIESNPDAVMNLFCQKSSITGNLDLSAADQKTRYENEGIAYRLYDIVQENIRIVPDKNGNYGRLLSKAGETGDVTEYSNQLYKEIQDYQTKIDDMNDRLDKKRTEYYKKFSNLEAAISKMNAQYDYLASQFSSGS